VEDRISVLENKANRIEKSYEYREKRMKNYEWIMEELHIPI
jgi:hypothetical protein